MGQFLKQNTWPYLSGDTEGKSLLLASVVCIRNETGFVSTSSWTPDGNRHSPVKTNCPTVAENPDRKALKGYIRYQYLEFIFWAIHVEGRT